MPTPTVGISEESRKLTTINTHKGLFHYNSLPFGISSAPSIFQRTIETLLAGIPNVAIYIDDILVSGASESEHLETLEKVFKRLLEAGLTLKLQKCQFILVFTWCPILATLSMSMVYIRHLIRLKRYEMPQHLQISQNLNHSSVSLIIITNLCLICHVCSLPCIDYYRSR